MHRIRRRKTIGQGSAVTREREGLHELLGALIGVEQGHGLHQGSGGHAVRQGHAAHVGLHQVFHGHAGIRERLAHRLLGGLGATLPARGNGGVASQNLGQGVIGFEHHVLRLLEQGGRLHRPHLGRPGGRGRALGQGEAQARLLAGGVERIHERLLGGHGGVLRAHRVACGRLARHRVRFERNRVDGGNLPAGHVALLPAGVDARAGEERGVQVDGHGAGRLIACGNGLDRLLGKGGQAGPPHDLLRVGGSRTQQGVASGHEVQRIALAHRAGGQVALQVGVTAQGEEGQNLEGGGGHARGVGVGGVQVARRGGRARTGEAAVQAGHEDAVLRVGAVGK